MGRFCNLFKRKVAACANKEKATPNIAKIKKGIMKKNKPNKLGCHKKDVGLMFPSSAAGFYGPSEADADDVTPSARHSDDFSAHTPCIARTVRKTSAVGSNSGDYPKVVLFDHEYTDKQSLISETDVHLLSAELSDRQSPQAAPLLKAKFRGEDDSGKKHRLHSDAGTSPSFFPRPVPPPSVVAYAQLAAMATPSLPRLKPQQQCIYAGIGAQQKMSDFPSQPPVQRAEVEHVYAIPGSNAPFRFKPTESHFLARNLNFSYNLYGQAGRLTKPYVVVNTDSDSQSPSHESGGAMNQFRMLQPSQKPFACCCATNQQESAFTAALLPDKPLPPAASPNRDCFKKPKPLPPPKRAQLSPAASAKLPAASSSATPIANVPVLKNVFFSGAFDATMYGGIKPAMQENKSENVAALSNVGSPSQKSVPGPLPLTPAIRPPMKTIAIPRTGATAIGSLKHPSPIYASPSSNPIPVYASAGCIGSAVKPSSVVKEQRLRANALLPRIEYNQVERAEKKGPARAVARVETSPVVPKMGDEVVANVGNLHLGAIANYGNMLDELAFVRAIKRNETRKKSHNCAPSEIDHNKRVVSIGQLAATDACLASPAQCAQMCSPDGSLISMNLQASSTPVKTSSFKSNH